jgi:hypothetical protein
VVLDFTADDDALFEALGSAGVYTPPAGAPVDVVVILDQGDAPVGFPGDGGARAPERFVRVRKSEVALPVRNATIVVGAETLKLGTPELDEAGAVWLIGCRT